MNASVGKVWDTPQNKWPLHSVIFNVGEILRKYAEDTGKSRYSHLKEPWKTSFTPLKGCLFPEPKKNFLLCAISKIVISLGKRSILINKKIKIKVKKKEGKLNSSSKGNFDYEWHNTSTHSVNTQGLYFVNTFSV